MRMLWPTAEDAVDPVVTYAQDTRTIDGRPWVVVNMITTVDGCATDTAGRSGGLGSPGDRSVFSAIRAVADVVVAGAATVIAEDYGPSRPSAAVRARRVARGQPARPRIAVVTASLRIDPGRRLFTQSPPDARPIVLTVERADPTRRQALEAVADVCTAGPERVDWHRALDVLGEVASARVVLCEGGPKVVGQLVADDLVDELCVTIAPMLLACPGPHMTHGLPGAAARHLTLDRVLSEEGYLFLRYLRDRSAD